MGAIHRLGSSGLWNPHHAANEGDIDLPSYEKSSRRQQAMLDRIDRLENFANAALFLADDMRKTLPQGTEESDD